MVEHKTKINVNPKIENIPSEIKLENSLHSTKLEDNNDLKVDAQKKVEPITIGELLNKNIKRKKAYELYVPSILSRIFFTRYKVSDFLEEEEMDNSSTVIFNEEVAESELDTMSELIQQEDIKIKKILTIRIKPNNVFCTLKNLISNRMVSGSSTKYKVKMSKKTLRYNYKIVIRSFLEETKKVLKTKFLFVCIVAPRRIRRDLLRILKKKLMFKPKSILKLSPNKDEEEIVRKHPHLLMFDFYAKKCFNGCRARKKKRKKQRGLRIYK